MIAKEDVSDSLGTVDPRVEGGQHSMRSVEDLRRWILLKMRMSAYNESPREDAAGSQSAR